MILVDTRKDEGAKLFPAIKGMGISCEKYQLDFGDVAFDGKTPDGTVLVGVERKTLHDMLNCIDSGRFSGFQLPGMRASYGSVNLIVEGNWKPNTNGVMLEGFTSGGNFGNISWGPCKHPTSGVMYHKIRRYLFSVQKSGVDVMFTRDLFHTAFDICELYHWYQKAEHRSLMEKQRVIVPSMANKPSLIRRWAEELTGIGSKSAEAAARYFKKPIRMAQADEMEWVKAGISGIGVKTAQNIVREIRG